MQNIQVFALTLIALFMPLAAQANPAPQLRWSIFVNTGAPLVSSAGGTVATIADQVTIAQQVGVAYRFHAHWSVRLSLLMAETPSSGTWSIAGTPWLAFHAGVFFIGIGPLLGRYPYGIDGGVFTATGIALPLSGRWRLILGAQIPILYTRPTISLVTGVGVAWQF